MKKIIKIFIFLFLIMISYNVYAIDKLKTCSYEIKDTQYGRIIIGADEETSIPDFISKINILPEYLEVYEVNGEKIDYTSQDIVKTGMKIKYVKDNNTLDEVTIVVRGDVNRDGAINVLDKVILQDHLLIIDEINDYRLYALDLDDNEGINISDNVKLGDYILHKEGIKFNEELMCSGYEISYDESVIDHSYVDNPIHANEGDTVTARFHDIEGYNVKVVIGGKTLTNGRTYKNPDGTISKYTISNGEAVVTNVKADLEFRINTGIYVDLSKTGQVYSYQNKANLTSVEFVNYIDLSNADTMWDITNDQNNLAYAWIEGTKLYIGSTYDLKSLSLESAFDGMLKVKDITFNGKLDTSETTSMKNMFNNCKALTEIDVSEFDTSNVITFERMFAITTSLVEIDVSEFNTSSAESMTMMFSRSANKGTTTNKLERIIGLENFDTSNLIRGDYLFGSCDHVKELKIENWNTDKLTDMSFMFLGNHELISLDLSKWNTSNVTRMDQLFAGCLSLINLDVSTWNTSKVGNMFNMFRQVPIYELNISNFNTERNNNFSGMFSAMPNIEVLDLSSFDTSNAKYIDNMFNDSTKLKTIYVSDKWNYTKTSSLDFNIFGNNPNLIGGSGTMFDSSMTNTIYGRIDGGILSPGYFTRK